MRATVMYAAREICVVDVPNASIVDPTYAVVRVTRACICGSDLWPYRAMERSESGLSMGHEALGVVEAVGREVDRVRVGNMVITPFATRTDA
jgi:threonine dehydrogenase-like Zn-dependent dehydrogenase